MGSAAVSCILLSVLSVYWTQWVWGQELRDGDALCNEEGCFVIYFQRKTFLESWKSCKEKGGNLATVKRPEDATMIEALFSGVEPHGSRAKVRVWIGLQRQPRQCSATRPLRGFTWITGDQDTKYTNWLREDSPNTCTAPRCVVMIHSTTKGDQWNNFKWLDGSCTLPVDGFLCRYSYKGMCQAIQSEGGGLPLYTTPFNLITTMLTHLPFGTVATVPCLDGTKGDQSVLCMLKEDGTVGWNKDAPLCSDAPRDWCKQESVGCEHYCMNLDTHYYCECWNGFQLAEDGKSCKPVDTCLGAPCEFECQPLSGGYICMCPEGYLLASNGQDCLDVDECLQSPCPQLCVNAPGTFECSCHQGYHPNVGGECVDVDECLENPCAHDCENMPGSYACHCHLGFSPLPEDPSRCQDTDECQIPGTCQQMCVNYEGGFECHCEENYELQEDHFSCRIVTENMDHLDVSPAYSGITNLPDLSWIPQIPEFTWIRLPGWLTESTPLNWLTEPPNLQQLPTDLRGFTDGPSERPMTTTLDHDRLADGLIPGWVTRDWIEYAVTPSGPTATPYQFEEQSTPSTAHTNERFEGESTTNPSTPSTSTPGSGSRQWWQHTSPPKTAHEGIQKGGTEQQSSDKDKGSESHTGVREGASGTHSTPLLSTKSKHGMTGGSGRAAEDVRSLPSTEQYPPLVLNTLFSSFTPVPDTAGQPDSGNKQRQDKSWLLVALLVPLSVFVVVMLALGIVYCTRCAVQPRNKSVTACYRWITNSKPDAASSTKSRV
ncbi:endosialin-like [Scleropages formosus]|uniref:Endosialin-like n=1 Tax=Scleropages formosus TaxID=113540 RepID=A0A0P7WYZ5_SCLFO|nr:endosialin-like [Scleropages formosus]